MRSGTDFHSFSNCYPGIFSQHSCSRALPTGSGQSWYLRSTQACSIGFNLVSGNINIVTGKKPLQLIQGMDFCIVLLKYAIAIPFSTSLVSLPFRPVFRACCGRNSSSFSLARCFGFSGIAVMAMEERGVTKGAGCPAAARASSALTQT